MDIRKAFDWIKSLGLAEKYNPYHYPKGHPLAGKFAPKGMAGGATTVPYRGTRVYQKLVERGLAKPWEPKVKRSRKIELAKLEGTEKQVKWATDIRKGVFDFLVTPEAQAWRQKGIESQRKRVEANPQDKMAQSSLKATQLFEKRLASKDSAKFWINNRDLLDLRANALDQESGLYRHHDELLSYERWAARVQAR